MKNSTVISTEDIQYIKRALTSAQAFIDNDLDAICDDEYKDEAENVLDSINRSLNLLDKYL